MKTRVKELRARFDWTQDDLAKRVGVTRQTIGLIEKGDYQPSIVLAIKIAREFQEPVEEVFILEGE